MCRLDGDRQAKFLCESQCFGGRGNRAIGTGNQRRADLLGNRTRLQLVAECLDHLRIGADPDEAGIDDSLRKLAAFREKTVTGMHGIGARALRNRNELVDIEIAVLGGHAVQRIGLIGQVCEQRVRISIGVNGDRGQAVILAGPDDPHRDLAAVCYQNLFHGHFPGMKRGAKRLTALKRIFAPTGIWPARSR
ncbi:hypothetical protein D3C80_563890 [compost metagenome]